MSQNYIITCKQCGFDEHTVSNHLAIGEYSGLLCPLCSGRMVRKASFYFRRSMPEHFNVAVGDYVGNKQQWSDGLKRAEEAASIRTGLDAHYVEADLGDTKTLGVTEEGLAKKFKQIDDMGKKRPKI